MNDLTPQQIRAVAEHYRVDGWEPGQMCDRQYVNRTYKGCKCYTCGTEWGHPVFDEKNLHLGDHAHPPHEIPPPNILEPAGAWALLVAIPESKGWTVCSSPAWVIVHDHHGNNLGECLVSDDYGYCAALARAAYEAIPEESRNAE